MRLVGSCLLGLLAASAIGNAHGSLSYDRSWPASWKHGRRAQQKSFQRIATLGNYLNNSDIADETVSEIVTSTEDGNTLVYSDGPMGEIGFIDIADPHTPMPTGKVEVGGEPTSVSALGNKFALVGVNTSESFVEPSGHLAVVDIESRSIVAELPLGGQPDSVAISPDRRFAAVAIENERDEDITVDGVEGGLPQAPPGFLAIVDLMGSPANWQVRKADVTGLSAYAPEDPEPEFVDINSRNQAVVSMQENNHIAIVNLRTGKVVRDFSAGTKTLEGVDATEDDVISLSETLLDVPREPDGITWLGGGSKGLIATANEGDLFGGSRGFSIFDRRGNLVFDSDVSVEEIAVRYGHYPEARSENKGSEPEGVEYARFGQTDYLFVGSERGSFVAIYELGRHGQAEFVNLLPAPLGPEGVLAIPSRNLLVASGEEDDPSFGVRSTVMIYELGSGDPTYPQLISGDDADGKPIPWSAMSGMTGVPGSRSELLAVWDSFYSESRIFTIDTSETPAVVTSATTIVGGGGNYDPEGITVAPDGTYWVASEGNASGSRPNRLLHTEPDGTLLQEVFLPDEIEACRAASESTTTLGSGFEGVAALRTRHGYKLFAAQQRGWDYTTPECEDLDDDPDGSNPSEPGMSRIWSYDPASGDWGHFGYELEDVPPDASWVGLSEITTVPGGFIVIERDNRTGDFATLKTLVKFSYRALADGVVTRDEKKTYDLLPDLLATNGWISDKPEGVGITGDGSLFVVTDNDGVDDWSGETWFLRLGKAKSLFR